MNNSANTHRYLLLDSCILEYILNKNLSTVLTDQLNVWRGNVFDLAMSHISYSELLDGAKQEKEVEVLNLLNKFYSFEVSKRVTIGCGKLGCVYKEILNEESKKISLADKIIATTSIINNLPIVTANVHDFPHPFFTEIDSNNVVYSVKRKKRMIVVAVLKPNYKYIKYSFENRK